MLPLLSRGFVFRPYQAEYQADTSSGSQEHSGSVHHEVFIPYHKIDAGSHTYATNRHGGQSLAPR